MLNRFGLRSSLPTVALSFRAALKDKHHSRFRPSDLKDVRHQPAQGPLQERRPRQPRDAAASRGGGKPAPEAKARTAAFQEEECPRR